MSKRYTLPNDPHFKNFVADLTDVIAGYTKGPGDLTARQKVQVERLVELEQDFRAALLKTNTGKEAYKKFVQFVMSDKRSLLLARPYFRERQEVFKEFISPALRNRDDEALHRFGINYLFVNWVLKNFEFKSNSVPVRIAKELKQARQELIEVNLPLAISRARIFRRSTPESHLEYMDLVQLSAVGLVTAVDKFCLPYTPVFRAVIIGRSTGLMIDSYSSTMLRFNSSDKTKLYRANKARARGNADLTPDQVSVRVNSASTDGKNKTNPTEIAALMSAQSHVSADQQVTEVMDASDDGEIQGIEKYAAPVDTQPDFRMEEAELRMVLRESVKDFSLYEQKLIRMQGIDFEITR